MAGFVHKNGQKFEQVTRAKQRGNPEFAFLDSGGDGNEYYAWLRHAARVGVDPKKPPGACATFDPVALAEAARKIADAAAAERDGATKGEGDAREGAKTRVGPWQAVKDSSGRTYYWNRDTQATTWTPPDGSNRLFPDVAASASVVRRWMDGRCEPYHTRRRIS